MKNENQEPDLDPFEHWLIEKIQEMDSRPQITGMIEITLTTTGQFMAFSICLGKYRAFKEAQRLNAPEKKPETELMHKSGNSTSETLKWSLRSWCNEVSWKDVPGRLAFDWSSVTCPKCLEKKDDWKKSVGS